ncbi:MAG TPA: glycine zipper 2TM domain-containing protein [Usitatibacter sp.]|nr:glycine zipper 2TM domain-containing protein [Usitatibacter sp.]
MKNTLIAAAIAAAFAGPAVAETFVDSAPVLSARPITESTPVNREECWSEQRRGYEERRVTRQSDGAPVGAGTVLGAIIGGVAGHQVGGGRGKDAATVGGAVVGGLIGNQVDREQGRVGPGSETVQVERRPVTREVERCRTVQEVRQVPVGYDVRYRYGGREFVTRLPYDPGRRIRLAVDVRVAEEAPPPPNYRR